jgi:ribosomal protein S18 acetylase RimI-like enzyme
MRLRQATRADDEFCFLLNEASMRDYVEPIYGWDLDDQRRRHDEWFDPDRLAIVEDDDGTAIGVVDVIDKGDHLYLSRMALLPEAQDQGIGTSLVRDLLRPRRPVRLHVFTSNARALRFYERLGFIVDHDAEREHHVSMHHPGLVTNEG